MANRLKFIPRQKGSNNKRVFKYIKYPNIPLSVDDIYAITIDGDRLDLIANQFYNDVDLWWIISTANPDIIRRDSFNLRPGLQIRIPDPASVNNILRSFQLLNN
jgi:phage tail protein X